MIWEGKYKFAHLPPESREYLRNLSTVINMVASEIVIGFEGGRGYEIKYD